MSTFLELQNEVIDNCQELAGSLDFTRAKVKYFINKGQREFIKKTKCTQKKIDLTTVANQESYTLPGDVYMIEHIRYIEDPGNEFGLRLKPYPGGFDALPNRKIFANPKYYWFRYIRTRSTAEIGTWPVASVADKTIRVWCSYFPPDMSANDDVSAILTAWHDAMVNYTIWKLHDIYAHKNKNIRTKAIDHRSNFLELVQDAIFATMGGTDDEPGYVRDIYER